MIYDGGAVGKKMSIISKNQRKFNKKSVNRRQTQTILNIIEIKWFEISMARKWEAVGKKMVATSRVRFNF